MDVDVVVDVDVIGLIRCGQNWLYLRDVFPALSHAMVHSESGDEAVIVEGVAKDLTDDSVFEQFKKAYKSKYEWDIDRSMGPIYAVRPRVAFGLIEHDELFTKTATRWSFDGA